MSKPQKAEGCYPIGDAIEVRFTWRPEGADAARQFRPRLDMKPTAGNLKHARRLRATILEEIKHGTFNLLRHFPDYKFAARLKDESPAGTRTFKDWSDVWATLAARNLEHSTLAIYKRHLAAYWLPAFGDMNPAKISNEKILGRLAVLAAEREVNGKIVKGLSRKTQNNILIPLRGVFSLICRSPGWTAADPTDGIDNMKVQLPDPDPFTSEELDIILSAMRKQPKWGDEWADYFEFAAFAGLRPSEHIALLWSDVDLRTATIKVRRARVMTEDKERTKTHVEREVELNARAAAVIQRQRARTQANLEGGNVVFRHPNTGRPWNDEQEQSRVWALVLRQCGVRHRPPKELRDTSVTMALLSGADPWWVAQQHGHSLQVMLKSYAKWMPKGDRGRNREAVNKALQGTGT
jgi:integrase